MATRTLCSVYAVSSKECGGVGGGGGAGVDVSHFVVIYITPVREMSSAITGLCCKIKETGEVMEIRIMLSADQWQVWK